MPASSTHTSAPLPRCHQAVAEVASSSSWWLRYAAATGGAAEARRICAPGPCRRHQSGGCGAGPEPDEGWYPWFLNFTTRRRRGCTLPLLLLRCARRRGWKVATLFVGQWAGIKSEQAKVAALAELLAKAEGEAR